MQPVQPADDETHPAHDDDERARLGLDMSTVREAMAERAMAYALWEREGQTRVGRRSFISFAGCAIFGAVVPLPDILKPEPRWWAPSHLAPFDVIDITRLPSETIFTTALKVDEALLGKNWEKAAEVMRRYIQREINLRVEHGFVHGFPDAERPRGIIRG